MTFRRVVVGAMTTALVSAASADLTVRLGGNEAIASDITTQVSEDIARAEQLSHLVLGAPEHRRCEAGRRGSVLGDNREELADRSVGDPVRHADAAAGLANAE